MHVLIVEDETAAYENLVAMIHEADPTIEVLGNTESVAQTVRWLQGNPPPDLIFLDIHLSDGSAFALFDAVEVEAPIVFTTAYDAYAIDAFRVNSVDYLLKPIKPDALSRALHKAARWGKADVLAYLERLTRLHPSPRYRDRLLVTVRDRLIPVSLSEVSCFYTSGKQTVVVLSDGTSYPYPRSLEQIFAGLNPADFFRANKQYILGRRSVTDITIWFDNRLRITLDAPVPEPIYISKNRSADFKDWIVHTG